MIHVVLHVDHGDAGPAGEFLDDEPAFSVDPARGLSVDADGDAVAHLREDPSHVGDALGGISLPQRIQGIGSEFHGDPPGLKKRGEKFLGLPDEDASPDLFADGDLPGLRSRRVCAGRPE